MPHIVFPGTMGYGQGEVGKKLSVAAGIEIKRYTPGCIPRHRRTARPRSKDQVVAVTGCIRRSSCGQYPVTLQGAPMVGALADRPGSIPCPLSLMTRGCQRAVSTRGSNGLFVGFAKSP